MKDLVANTAIIGGSGLESLLNDVEAFKPKTPYGSPSKISIGTLKEEKVAFVPRHGKSHTLPPHHVNYRANIYALHLLGVQRVCATNAVGGINAELKAGDLVVPHDFVDFTKHRKGTFYDKAPVTHVDMSQPYCPELRRVFVEAARIIGENARSNAIMACTEGPRYETPAEVHMLSILGCDVVGMTGLPEAVLAREMQLCYASLCYVSNMAVGLQKRQSASELKKIVEKKRSVIKQVLIETIASLPKTRGCDCAHALEDARL